MSRRARVLRLLLRDLTEPTSVYIFVQGVLISGRILIEIFSKADDKVNQL